MVTTATADAGCSTTSDSSPDNAESGPTGGSPLNWPCGISRGEIQRSGAFGGSYLTYAQVLED